MKKIFIISFLFVSLFGIFEHTISEVRASNAVTLPFGHEKVQHLPSIGVNEQTSKGEGVEGIKKLSNTLGSFLSLVLGTIAIFALFVAGYQLITAQSAISEQSEQQKMNVVYIVLGLIVFGLAGRVVYGFLFADEGQFLLQEESAILYANRTVNEIRRILNLFLSFSGAGAILMLVIAGIRLVLNPGEDEQIEKQKKVVGYTAVGIIIIGLADTVVNRIVFPRGGYEGVNVPLLEIQLQGLSNYILGFLGVVIFVSFVLSGVMMVANFGNEEVVGKIKTTLKNVVIGTFVAYSAYTIVATLLRTFLAAEGGAIL